MPCSKISIIYWIYSEFFNQNWWRNKFKEALLYVIIEEINKWMHKLIIWDFLMVVSYIGHHQKPLKFNISLFLSPSSREESDK